MAMLNNQMVILIFWGCSYMSTVSEKRVNPMFGAVVSKVGHELSFRVIFDAVE